MLAVNTITDDRQMRVLTGLDLSAFCALAEPFAQGCQAEADARSAEQQPRQRRPGGGRKVRLARSGQKLLSILYYLKACLSFDRLATTFSLSRSKACEHAHRLPKALRTLDVLPVRTIDSWAHMQQFFAHVPVLLLDATEWPYRRAQAAVDRPADYSSKKGHP